MIDRKALRIFLPLLLAMLGASIWRLTLPDWRMPANGAGGHDIVNGLALFGAPISVLLFLLGPFLQWRMAPEEARPSLRRYNGKIIVAWSLFLSLMHAFVLARTLGLVSQPSDVATARGGMAMIGFMFMIIGNFAPKAPSLPQRSSFQPDPWKTSRLLRFAGKLLVGLGLAFVLGGLLLPLEYWQPIFTSLMLTAMAAGIWYSFKLRQERSLQ